MAHELKNFTIGIEEEFQIVDKQTLHLTSGFDTLFHSAPEDLKEYIKPEFLQSVLEIITPICATIDDVDTETKKMRSAMIAVAKANNMDIISAGTHPISRWGEQRRSSGARYAALEQRLQDISRSILIFGLHVHICVADLAERLQIINQARTFLPHILALSANSPFWMKRITGLMSYRTMVWGPFPFSGTPPIFQSVEEYNAFRKIFEYTHSVDDVRKVWWDIRPHTHFPTIEFRIADMPATHEDTMAITAFWLALVKTLHNRILEDRPLPVFRAEYINENKWRAARYGLSPECRFIDFEQNKEISATDALKAALDFVAPAAEQLGAAKYLKRAYQLAGGHAKTGAEMQLDRFYKTGSFDAVTQLLAEQTHKGIPTYSG